MKRLLLFAIILFQYSVALAQKDTVAIINSYDPAKGLQLKWLPTSFPVFLAGFKQGYNLSRAEVLKENGGEKTGDFVILHDTPIKYWKSEKLYEELKTDSSLITAGLFIEGAQELIHRLPASTQYEAIERAKADEMLHLLGSFAAISSNKVADALGMFFIDKDYSPDKKYLYKIEIPGNEKLTSYLLVFPYQNQPKEKVMALSSRLYPAAVHLSWFNNGNRNYPYFNIYRSEKKNGKYQKLNKLPYVGDLGNAKFNNDRTSYIDSFPAYNKTYYYKVVGINAFEEEGTPSDPVEVKTFYLLKSSPVIVKTVSDNKNITLTWAVEEEDRPYIKGFSVKRAKRGEGPYRKVNKDLLSAKTFTFTDNTSKSSSNYYAVTAYGQGGDSITSLLKAHLLVDSFPPEKPVIVLGKCDTNGIVTLQWKKNPEDDMEGYRVFKLYDIRHEPVRVTSGHITDTILVDTINLKRPYNKIYYRIVALDQVFNSSVPSDFFEIILPDKNPPSPGYLTTYSAGMKGIQLNWQPSNAYDLKKVYLMKKSELDFDFQVLKEFYGDTLRTSSYVDTATKAGVTYTYALIAEDEAGLKSVYSNMFIVEQLNNTKVMAVTNLQAIASRDNKMVKLTWDFPQNAVGFRIYRSRNKDQISTYEFVPGDKREFYDKWLKPNSKYTYQIVAELKDGFQSGYSNEIQVKY